MCFELLVCLSTVFFAIFIVVWCCWSIVHFFDRLSACSFHFYNLTYWCIVFCEDFFCLFLEHRWYFFKVLDRFRSVYCNIISEFADVEIFVISLDGLLVELTAHKYLNWTLGGQTVVIAKQVRLLALLKYLTEALRRHLTETYEFSVKNLLLEFWSFSNSLRMLLQFKFVITLFGTFLFGCWLYRSSLCECA